ncbi:MAG TPA: carboxypeptidase regulatory-like domain-containing protein [Propionibacteriaceae bacterium]|nr:carboxypeptidase regulatory-like domain-containing protein [Propionibacteriaceae bacterium]
MLRRLILGLLLAGCLATSALVLATPAAAATSVWATFTSLHGSPRLLSTTMTQPVAGFPTAAVVTDSGAGSLVAAADDSSVLLPPDSPLVSKYGSGRGAHYLNLTAHRSDPFSASVTTYTFSHPTPARGWSVILGGLDADRIVLTATDGDGRPLPPAALGFRGPVTSATADTAQPFWDPATGTILGAPDRTGLPSATVWFEPTAALSTLTLSYSQLSDNPGYLTTFAALSHSVSGTVTAPTGQRAGILVRLLDVTGGAVTQTRTRPDGTYTFLGVATDDSYRVELVRPSGLASDGPLARNVDLRLTDQVGVDFELRPMVPVQASGTVRNALTDALLPGVEVRLTGPGDFQRTLVTDGSGQFLFDHVPVGQGYELQAASPPGYRASPPVKQFNVPANSEAPIGGLRIALTPLPFGSVQGAVRTPGTAKPVANVELTIHAPDGSAQRLRTAVDGTYGVGRLSPGRYAISITPPTRTELVGGGTAEFTIGQAGNDVTGKDFVLRPLPDTAFTARGKVARTDGTGLSGVRVLLTNAEGTTIEQFTNSRGRFAFRDLPTGDDYRARVEPSPGLEVSGGSQRVFDITDADVSTGTFIVVPVSRVSRPSPTPEAAPTVAPAPTGDTHSTAAPLSAIQSPSTAAPGSQLLVVGSIAALLLGVALVLLGRRLTWRT